MRVPRIYHPEPLSSGQRVSLTEDAANHVGRVLRLSSGDQLELFCGDDHRYQAVIEQASKKHVDVLIKAAHYASVESPLKIHLIQGISRGDRMDFTLQKSVELGVSSITPIFSERCGVKLQGDRLQKRHLQWQKIVIAACEQSGRNTVPLVHPALTLENYLATAERPLTLILDPVAKQNLKSAPVTREVSLLIGPEGGFSDTEISLMQQSGCLGVRLGPRILRTETAALAAISALQTNHGDLI